MEKLTFEQIIQKLKDNNISLEDFAYEEVGGNIEDYPEALEAQKTRKEHYEKHKGESWKTGAECVDVYNSMPNEYEISKNKFREQLGLNWEEVEQYGGEGQGDTWYSVKYFKDHDVYIKVNGWYQSYNGTEFHSGWDSCKEVKPSQKTITVYENI